MRRGFLSFAEGLALETRQELGLSPADPLDPKVLADHLAIPVVTLSSLSDIEPDAVEHLVTVDIECFSAATVLRGTRRLIVANDAHTPGRQANSIAHEIAHVLLEHSPAGAFDDLGNGWWNDDQEDEANWLAGCLLVPRQGILPVMYGCDLDSAMAAGHFGVSTELMRWRWHKSGAALQVQRAAKRRRD